jgi:hypothetical protein
MKPFYLMLFVVFTHVSVISQINTPNEPAFYKYSNGEFIKIEETNVKTTKLKIDIKGKSGCITENSDNDITYKNDYGEIEIIKAEDMPQNIPEINIKDSIFINRIEEIKHKGWYLFELEKNKFSLDEQFTLVPKLNYDFYLISSQGIHPKSENPDYLYRGCGYTLLGVNCITKNLQYSKRKIMFLTNELFPFTENNVNYVFAIVQ